MEAAGLRPEDQGFFWLDNIGFQNLERVADYLFERLEGHTGVLCYNDEVAFKLIQMAQKRGIEIPEDLSVVSIDNSNLADICPVPFTSCFHPKLLDPAGNLQAGIPLCPPEGDAGTGMVATNSVGVRTGNISAGTSVFGIVVLEKDLSKVYPEIDLVTTPAGDLVAMAHCNTCTSDLNAWVNIFDE